MGKLHPDAVRHNQILADEAPDILPLLSQRGVSAYFPRLSIITQADEATGTRINATQGIALNDDGTLMVLPEMVGQTVEPEWLDYAPSNGLKEFQDAWLAHILESNPQIQLKGQTITKPVTVSGLVNGLYILGQLFLDEGDRILIPEPFWGPYTNIFTPAQVVPIPALTSEGFSAKSLEATLDNARGRKIAVLLNFPNNPTGYSPTGVEAVDIANVIERAAEQGTSILAIIDDAYIGLGYSEEIYPHSMFNLLAGIHRRVLAAKVDGTTKELYAWGLRVAAVTLGFKGMTEGARGAFENKIEGMVRDINSRASTGGQIMAARALAAPTFKESKERNYHILRERYGVVKAELASHPEYAECFTPLPFNSGYFMCARLREGLNANEVRKKLIADFSTGVISSGDHLIRVAFSSVAKGKIPELFRNLYQACRN